ncbi:MAG: ATP-dependent helicase [Planctomycetes bacterium]|nr:ATP-dependent helicase [Planctomycetota bacterium]
MTEKRASDATDTAVEKTVRRQPSKGPFKGAKISRLRKPEDMSLEQWQIALRRQFARKQNFRLVNVGGAPVFSEFTVTNRRTGGEYRVAIRGQGLGENYCSCPDFAVNTLGTCKHIEWVLGKLRRQPGAARVLAQGFRPLHSEIYLRYGARREIVLRPGVECPPGLHKLAADYFDNRGVLQAPAYARFDTFLKRAGALGHDLRCYDDALDFIAEVRDRAALTERIDKAFPAGVGSAAFAHLLKVPLYPYQREGALFAARAGRSLIADDMGLGKTIQAIAAGEILARAAGVERILIVCPTSLKYQWQQEIEKFCGRPALVVEGSLARRAELYRSDSFYKITNYDVVHRDLEAIQQWGPEIVILDEAQRIKNWKTRRAQTIKRLHSKYAIVLTGTPLENRLEELHSIVEFVDRFRLGPMFRFLAEHQHTDESGKVIGYGNLDTIGRTLQPILIRRTKKEVLKQLPERLDKNYFVPMTSEQMAHHQENAETVARVVAKWRRFGFLSEADQRRLMIALQNMRMSCNSTYLLDKKTDFGYKADELLSVLQESFEQPGDKAVIFSQWVRTHELIVPRLETARLGHVLFHGGVDSRDRRGLIARFKEDPGCRIFLSTDAGGVGLNLQNAATVINMDLPWNPAVLDQRIGRVHRLGQHRPVRVVNFVAQGTIEQGMLAVLAFKQSMFAGVLDGGTNEVFLGGTRLKRFMESVDKVTQSIPAPMPPEEKVASDLETAEDLEQDLAPTSPAAEGGRAVTDDRCSAAEPDWGNLIAAGVALLSRLAGAAPAEAKPPTDATAALRIETDASTGQRHLKVPVPSKDILRGLAGLLSQLAEKL